MKNFFLISLLLMGVFIIFTGGCKKDDVPVLTTVEVTDITSTTAKSGGNITSDASSTVTGRGVCWSTSANPTIANSHTTDGSGAGSFTSVLTGLHLGTTYYVRAYATNSNGTGYGATMTFKTETGGGTFTDSRDGNVYRYVTIGNQVWMAENLRYLPSVVGSGTGSNTSPCYYVYDYDGTSVSAAKGTTNYQIYGVLYNWEAALSACPAGWHLPSDAEWTQLTDYLGGEDVAGDKLKETGTMHWDSPNTGATNETGFTALPGGNRLYNGHFYYIGNLGYWWSATEYATYYAWSRDMGSHYGNVNSYDYDKDYGFSVRCVRD